MTSWMNNFLGIGVLRSDLHQIQHPGLELGIHVTFKTLQVGAVTGAGIIGPLVATLNPGCRVSHVFRSAAKCGKIGALIGILVGPVLYHMKYKDISREEINERCYRLRHDRSELLVDRATVAGYAFGSLLSYGGVSTCGLFTMVTGVLFAEGYGWWSDKTEAEPLWFSESN